MKKPFGTKMKVWALGALAIFISGSFTSCKDEIPEESRFTFTGELISDHLKNDPDTYGHFCKILEQAKFGKKSGSMLTALSTYGAYTCFAPTNKAIENFLEEEYQKYLESVELHEKDTTIEIKKGITSNKLEELSDSMALVIAKNHIMEKSAKTTIEIVDGPFPGKTMNRRIVTLAVEESPRPGEPPVLTVENIEIEEEDIETENGYIHRINGVLSPSEEPTSSLLASQPGFSLFCEALEVTGFDKYLEQYHLDPDYDPEGIYVPAFKTEDNQVPPCPETSNHGFTLLVETDSLFADPSKNALGEPIHTIEDLEKYASIFYGTDSLGKYDDPHNPVYQFVAYHIIDRKLLYKGGAMTGGFVMENHQETTKNAQGQTVIDAGKFNSEINLGSTYDRYDYFETALPYTLMKITKPMSNSALRDEIVANYAQKMGEELVKPEMEYHINVIIESAETARETRPLLDKFQNSAVNGTIYTIDKILIYDEEEMSGNILNERMRWDVFSLFPELTNNDVRWAPRDKYSMTYIPENYSARLKQRNNDTHIYYLRPTRATYDGGYANYQGDEMLVIGKYDFEYRLPFVPAGTYEIRFGFSTSDSRGIAQFYINDRVCGIPLDMRIQNQAFMGWKAENTEDEEENRKNDKAMRNRGFMKAPASIFLVTADDKKEDQEPKNMRWAQTAYRRIVDRCYFERGKEYWLRFKDVTDGGTSDKPNQFNQDYLELVPDAVYNNFENPEDTN